VHGPAGTGKTFVTTMYAAQEFVRGRYDKIVITRPNKGTGESLGFYPGSIIEKMSPWLAETISIIKEVMSPAAYDIALADGLIEIVPFEIVRGRSFRNTIILLTEAQNTTIVEMKAFVTRTGEDSKVIIDGDILQSDIGPENGLVWALEMVERNKPLSELSGVVKFNSDDCVRSGLCAAWVAAIEKTYG
jgi:phosphate starvation-inducible PhoH-like protein